MPKSQRFAVISVRKKHTQPRAKLKRVYKKKIKMLSEINIYQQRLLRLLQNATPSRGNCHVLHEISTVRPNRAEASQSEQNQLNAQIVDTNDRVQMRTEKRRIHTLYVIFYIYTWLKYGIYSF